MDVTLKVDLSEAGRTDNVIDTVHYGEVFEEVKSIMEGKAVNLLEHLAERIANRINSQYNRVMETKVRITKENPPIPGHYDGVGIEIVRRINDSSILRISSNIGDRESQLNDAIKILNEYDGINVSNISPIYETAPVGILSNLTFKFVLKFKQH